MTASPGAGGESFLAFPSKTQHVVLTLLAAAAGCVDAVSFLGLGRVLTAAMTGNTVLLGLALGQGDAPAALRSTVALAGFVAGVLVGASIVERGPRPTWSCAVAAALALELVLLVVLAIGFRLADGPFPIDYRYPLIALAGLAMGLQSAVANRAGLAGITTTYVTGTLTILATRLIDRLRGHAARADDLEGMNLRLPAAVWLAYGVGAAFAGATYRWSSSVAPILGIGDVRWSSAALLLPILIVAIAALAVAHACRRRTTTA